MVNMKEEKGTDMMFNKINPNKNEQRQDIGE